MNNTANDSETAMYNSGFRFGVEITEKRLRLSEEEVANMIKNSNHDCCMNPERLAKAIVALQGKDEE